MPVYKKIFFSVITFFLFVLLLEGILALIPLVLGFQQRGAYDHILKGGTAIITLGDSVTYGYGLKPTESWPSQLERKLQSKGAHVSVINRAVSGMDSTEAVQREVKTIQDIANRGTRPVVLVMLGHNDLAGPGWRQWSAPTAETAQKESTTPPRLWRIFRWATTNKTTSTWSNPQKESVLKENILHLEQEVQRIGGRVYLLTYLLPGTAESSNPMHIEDIALSRSLQGRGNDIIRTLCSTNTSLGLIDIEMSVIAPMEWDATWFQDHIHPTALASEEIAISVQRHLVSYGEFPLSVLP